jgi:hypothetical protein
MSERLNENELELERLLGGLRPLTPGLNRDEMMFRAGQHSVRPKLRTYQAAAATLLVAFIASVGLPQFSGPQRPNAMFVEGSGGTLVSPAENLLASRSGLARDALRSGPAASDRDEPPSEGSLAFLRRAALTGGAEALPSPSYSPARQTTLRSWGALAG